MRHQQQLWIPLGAGVAVAFAALGGCVKREEKITVHKDGSIDLRMEVEGDRKDMEEGAPAIAKREGWVFAEHTLTEQDGKQKIHRQADITIAPGGSIPPIYPTDDPEGEALAMQHPTQLTIERRSDGTYYHFRRVYQPRKAAFVNVWWNDFYEEYGKANPAEMSAEKIHKFVIDLGVIARRKQTAIVRVAEQSLDDPWPQDLRLAVYDAINRVINAVDPEEVVQMLTAEDDNGDSESELDVLAKQIDDDVVDAIEAVLRDAGLSSRDIRQFASLLARERRRYAITDDYMDDYWRVVLKMPGTLVGHNGDKIEEGAVVWERKGEHFYDRTVELLATSKVDSNPRR